MFTVQGKGRFPISMLRFDECWPATDEDATKIEQSHDINDSAARLRWRIDLRTSSRHAPTVGRWESFNVRVVS